MRAPRKRIALKAGLFSGLLLSGCVHPPSPLRCPENPAQGFLEAINEVRTREGVTPVWPNILLARAAQGHARKLADGEAEGHFASDGSDPLQRITAEGYLPVAFGENVALGSSDPRLVLEAWMRSPAHKEVLLDPSVEEVGLGGVLDSDRPVWVANFGSRREESETRCHSWPIR
jgi:uncharacterized protein YkwD